MSKLFLISDTHFGHKNILLYEERPFDSISEMDESLVENWNNVVSKEDKVICLGDFSFYNKEKTEQIFNLLNGKISLVLGNHDRSRTVSWFRDIGFMNVYEYPICIDGFYWLSHEPMYMCRNMPYVNIHGHIHNKKLTDGILLPQHINVCVEHIDYKPIDFEEIRSRYINPDSLEI